MPKKVSGLSSTAVWGSRVDAAKSNEQVPWLMCSSTLAERARQEAEARKVAEQLEQRRLQLLQEYKAAESARVQEER